MKEKTTVGVTIGDSLGWKAMPEVHRDRLKKELVTYYNGIAADKRYYYYSPTQVAEAQKWVDDPLLAPAGRCGFLTKASPFAGTGFAALVGSLNNAPIDTIMYRIYVQRVLTPELRFFVINPLNFNEAILKSEMLKPFMGVYSRYGTTKERRILYGYIELPHLVGTVVKAPAASNLGFGDNCGAGYAVFTPKKPYEAAQASNFYYGVRANLFFLWDCGEPKEIKVPGFTFKKIWNGTVKGKEMVVFFGGATDAIWSQDGTL